MSAKSRVPEIHQEAFIKAREKLGLSIKDLAGKACLSSRQIEQIENGEMSSFYGAQVKITAAKKVAKILGLSESDAFEFKDAVSDLDVKTQVASDTPSESKKDASQAQSIQATAPIPQAKSERRASEEKSRNKQSSKKQFWAWGGLVAALVISAFNLHPLFFAEQPVAVIVKEEVIEPASAEPSVEQKPAGLVAAPAVVSPTSVPEPASSGDACPAPDAVVASYRPTSPKKAGDMVYVQARDKQVVCVLDASGKSQAKTVEPGLGTSFYGKPPFKVLTASLGQVDLYFQGAKVRPDNMNGKTILLEAGDFSQPATPADLQLR